MSGSIEEPTAACGDAANSMWKTRPSFSVADCFRSARVIEKEERESGRVSDFIVLPGRRWIDRRDRRCQRCRLPVRRLFLSLLHLLLLLFFFFFLSPIWGYFRLPCRFSKASSESFRIIEPISNVSQRCRSISKDATDRDAAKTLQQPKHREMGRVWGQRHRFDDLMDVEMEPWWNNVPHVLWGRSKCY